MTSLTFQSYSTQISHQISNFIFSKAHKLLMQHARAQTLVKQSYERNKKFPVECTKQLMQLYQFSPLKDGQLKYSRDQLLLPPQNPVRKIVKIMKSALVSPSPSRSRSLKRKQSGRMSRQTMKGLTKKGHNMNKCLPLGQQQQFDEEIQVLRQKKQKLYDLQNYFIESEQHQKQRKRYKHENLNKLNLPIHFNGDKMIKRAQTKRVLQDPYFNIEASSNIREREQNKCQIIFKELHAKNNNKCDQQRQSSSDTKRLTLEPHLSIRNESTTRIAFNRLQDLMNTQFKERKNDNMTKRSKTRITHQSNAF